MRQIGIEGVSRRRRPVFTTRAEFEAAFYTAQPERFTAVMRALLR